MLKILFAIIFITIFAYPLTSNQVKVGIKSNMENISTSYKYQCGTGASAQGTSFNFGCKGNVCVGTGPQTVSQSFFCQANNSPILDILFSIIRFLSAGVGLVVIASIIVGGIQYTTSGGDPQNVTKAIKRIRSSIVALVIFIFLYAIINYLVPLGFFKT